MAINITNSTNSFVRFNEDTPNPYCGWEVNFCLPVYAEEDVSFQFIITGTESEIDGLCRLDASEVLVELVSECGDEEALISFDEKPQRFSLSDTQILYNWEHGFPGWSGSIVANQCFKIRVTIFEGVYDLPNTFCSNCFERIMDACFTSVLDFGNDEDAFGYKYCHGGAVDQEPVSCEPTIISFTNIATLDIPYTQLLKDKYGSVPNIQTWIYDPAGVLTNMNIQATFDAYPPNHLLFDFGGPASGIIVIR